MKLLFNHETKSVVLHHNHNFIDMRNGKITETSKNVSTLKPFPKYNVSKEISQDLVNKIINNFKHNEIKYGYRINKIYLTKSREGKWHLSGYFPVYFFKGFIKYAEEL